jgi:CBS domain containing-hemolysin-like protein
MDAAAFAKIRKIGFSRIPIVRSDNHK